MDAAYPKIRLIALDLDGTLLNSEKKLTKRNEDALARAAGSGTVIVPTTGRLFMAMPEAVRSLPFVHYAILANGAQVYDITNDRVIARSELPLETAIEILRFMDNYPVVYDCFYNGRAYMSADAQAHIADYMPDPQYQEMVRKFRTPVPELKHWLKEQGGGVQKVQFFVPDASGRNSLMEELAARFPQTAVTSAVPNNIEVNSAGAQKGFALASLAHALGIDLSQTAAFGDGLNDISMIKAAGVGVAMANSAPQVLEAADIITSSNDADGVAEMVEKFGC